MGRAERRAVRGARKGSFPFLYRCTLWALDLRNGRTDGRSLAGGKKRGPMKVPEGAQDARMHAAGCWLGITTRAIKNQWHAVTQSKWR